MSDLTLKLLNLIKEGKTTNEIAEALNLSNKQLYNLITTIRNKGFDFERKYYYNGEIIYKPRNSFIYPAINEKTLITTPNDQDITMMVISDLHIGCEEERLDLLNKVYDYCVQEGIHIIINCGDLIDGTFGQNNKKYDNIIEQIDYLLKVYPFDKSILNYTLLGNHDLSALQNVGLDISIILQSYRHDIIPLGYGTGKINIKNDNIIVKHQLFNGKPQIDDFKQKLILKGHSHQMRVLTSNNNCIIYIPSLSNVNVSTENILPTATKLTLNFTNGIFKTGTIKQLLISDKIYSLNEFSFQINKTENQSNKIEHEESAVKKLIKKEEKYTPGMSQIEKFNERYKL